MLWTSSTETAHEDKEEKREEEEKKMTVTVSRSMISHSFLPIISRYKSWSFFPSSFT